eukprot:CAMPEP_0168763060 /NCGR_PEP_ID=MMETSP0724-20121128/24165_1 /TAXON_ID=265536 /ORGANISM="Amphiprora sp., Strain CCMP467" /LENGTH=514 /DNA_ID=CAMNT_0008812245 /DNA_START=194 /DNA_END=1738 /DNA_ORIENTATION=+
MGCASSKDQVEIKKTVNYVGKTERPNRNRHSDGKYKKPAVDKAPPKLDESGRLLPEEVVRRSTSSITTKTLTLGTEEDPVIVEYAHWTQRGYYPDDPHKENQDEFSVTTKFAGRDQDILLAVYDGHGKRGHECSRFAKRKLPGSLNKFLRQARGKKYQEQLKSQPGGSKGAKGYDPDNWPMLEPDEYKLCCRKGFLEVNKDMHKATNVEDTISGTTAITVSLHGTLMTVCNVGDSRAVLGHEVDFVVDNSEIPTIKGLEESKEEIEEANNGSTDDSIHQKQFPETGKLVAIPLSRDQTPYRKDERERVKKKGAAIMSIDQMEGKEEMHENWGDMVLGEDVDIHGDPPRVWIEGKDYPGTAFTRSLGDSMAESIGVTAEPEMLSRHLTKNDHMLIVASDGIFEFITNQEAVNIAAQCDSPIIACERLVKHAYNQWLVYEKRTDDITIIVCFLNVNKDPPKDGATGSTEDLVELAKNMYGNRPVRKTPRGVDDNLSSSIYDKENDNGEQKEEPPQQ